MRHSRDRVEVAHSISALYDLLQSRHSEYFPPAKKGAAAALTGVDLHSILDSIGDALKKDGQQAASSATATKTDAATALLEVEAHNGTTPQHKRATRTRRLRARR